MAAAAAAAAETRRVNILFGVRQRHDSRLNPGELLSAGFSKMLNQGGAALSPAKKRR